MSLCHKIRLKIAIYINQHIFIDKNYINRCKNYLLKIEIRFTQKFYYVIFKVT